MLTDWQFLLEGDEYLVHLLRVAERRGRVLLRGCSLDGVDCEEIAVARDCSSVGQGVADFLAWSIEPNANATSSANRANALRAASCSFSFASKRNQYKHMRRRNIPFAPPCHVLSHVSSSGMVRSSGHSTSLSTRQAGWIAFHHTRTWPGKESSFTVVGTFSSLRARCIHQETASGLFLVPNLFNCMNLVIRTCDEWSVNINSPQSSLFPTRSNWRESYLLVRL